MSEVKPSVQLAPPLNDVLQPFDPSQTDGFRFEHMTVEELLIQPGRAGFLPELRGAFCELRRSKRGEIFENDSHARKLKRRSRAGHTTFVQTITTCSPNSP